jgi:hypothetical protein
LDYLAAMAIGLLCVAMVLMVLRRLEAPAWVRYSISALCVVVVFGLTEAFAPLATAPLWVKGLNATLIGIAGAAAASRGVRSTKEAR